jgi:hypothetical protein
MKHGQTRKDADIDMCRFVHIGLLITRVITLFQSRRCSKANPHLSVFSIPKLSNSHLWSELKGYVAMALGKLIY